MIFVTVGTTHKPFDSLLKALDNFNKSLQIEISAQIGHSTYLPVHFKWFRFCSPYEMESYIREAEFIISHGGLAIIGECLRAGKPLVVFPRHPSEAVNPQNELVEFLAREGYLDYVDSSEELFPYLSGEKKPRQREFDFVSRTPDLVAAYVEQVLSI